MKLTDNRRAEHGTLPPTLAPLRPALQRRIKTRLLSVIDAAGTDEIAGLLNRLWSCGWFEVRRPPRTGLVMHTVRDPFGTPFHLGEVLVTEAEVTFDGHAGVGVICGDEPERALLLAAVEAAEACGRAMEDLAGDLEAFIERLSRRTARQRQRLAKLAAATTVRFESMKKENVDFGSLD